MSIECNYGIFWDVTVQSPIATYGGNVVQVDSVPTNDCLTDDVTGEELQYGVTSVSKLP